MWRAIAGLITAVGGIGENIAARGAGKIAKDFSRFHKGQVLLGALGVVGPILSTKGIHDPKERHKKLLEGWAVSALTLGYRHGSTQWLMSAAIFNAFEAPGIGRGIVQGLRTGISNRTMAAVPFSMTQINQQQAYAALEYARTRMGSAYSTMGNEAAMFAARYLQR